MNRFERNHRTLAGRSGAHINKGHCRFTSEFTLIPSKEDAPGLIFEENGEKVTLHSSYYPTREAIRWAESVKTEKPHIVCLGIGLGYGLDPLCKRFPDKIITVIEPDKNLFNLAMQTIDISKLPESVRFIIGYEDFEVLDFIGNIDEIEILEIKQRTRLLPRYFDAVKRRLQNKPIFDLSDQWKYKKFAGASKLKVIFIDSGYVLTKECLSALQQLGHAVQYIHIDKDNYQYDEFVRNFLTLISQFKPDFVLTINHLGFDQEGRMTELLSELEIPFISWFVDSPTVVLSGKDTNISDYCNIFVWDRDYIQDVIDAGYPHVDYLPLATMPELFKPLDLPYKTDVSFVGSSMVYSTHKNLRSMVFRRDLLYHLDTVALEFLGIDSRYVIEAIDRVRATGIELAFDYPEQQLDFEAAVLWRATQMYRLSGIEKLAPFYPTVFGDPNWDTILNNRYRIEREVLYYDNLPQVYNTSRINFNMTSRQMKNAVNQRVFDVPACGKFILTDYKQQLEEIFDTSGEEIVFFRDVEEIPELVAFYLENDSVRERYARNAYSRVTRNETYKHRLGMMIEIMRKRYTAR